jgi:hypothetical protein
MFYNLCEFVKTELSELDRKAKSGKISVPELEYADKLAHLKKSLLTNEAMEEADGGYSGRYMMPRYGYAYEGRSYADGDMHGDGYGGMSNAGRMNARRDSMGRYSRTGYSYHDNMDDLLDDMRGMLDKLPDERRRKAERLIDELSR